MRTLLELFDRMQALGSCEALRYDNGYRSWAWTYEELTRAARRFEVQLEAHGIRHGERVLVWSETCPEWVAAFWGIVRIGAVAVPLDVSSSVSFARRIHEQVDAKLTIVGNDVQPGAFERQSTISLRRFFRESECEEQSAASSPGHGPQTRARITGDTIVQLLFTSGTTGDPRGVVHRHRHLVANLSTLGGQIYRYRRAITVFAPLRFLNLVPLSHVFGQFMTVMLPPLMGAGVVFARNTRPSEAARCIARHRVSFLVAVPRQLQLLSDEIRRKHRISADRDIGQGLSAIPARWWVHRRVHRALGWKFWAVICGGARLEPEDETFWRRLGYAAVQGYGLTETSALVSTYHPFRPLSGTLGKPVGQQEVRLAPDGEILVRGPNVSTEYFRAGDRPVVEEDLSGHSGDAWLHTGDLGELDASGGILFRGRKKEIIVRADGVNVFPSDIERAFKKIEGVRAVVVVPHDSGEGEKPHAVMILDESADPLAVVSRANERLSAPQRVQGFSVWPGRDFPRTSTHKIRRHVVSEWLARDRSRKPAAVTGELVTRLQTRLDSLARRSADTRLSEELGWGSLDRVQLFSELEERAGATLDESRFDCLETVGELTEWIAELPSNAYAQSGKTIGESAAALEDRGSGPSRKPSSDALGFLSRRAHAPLLHWCRLALHKMVTRPLVNRYYRPRVEGLARLATLRPPVLFACNHVSHLDTPAVIAVLPERWRRRITAAMAYARFAPYFESRGSWAQRVRSAAEYWLAVVLVPAFPVLEGSRNLKATLRLVGQRCEQGYSMLIYPEGVRSPDGQLQMFRPGVGLFASELELPIVPLHLTGLAEALPPGARWPKRGRIRMSIGHPIFPHSGEDPTALTGRVEGAIRRLARESETLAPAGPHPPSSRATS